MTLAVLGVGLGCAGAVGLTRNLAGWICGVTPLDAAAFAGCATLMLLVERKGLTGFAMLAL